MKHHVELRDDIGTIVWRGGVAGPDTAWPDGTRPAVIVDYGHHFVATGEVVARGGEPVHHVYRLAPAVTISPERQGRAA